MPSKLHSRDTKTLIFYLNLSFTIIEFKFGLKHQHLLFPKSIFEIFYNMYIRCYNCAHLWPLRKQMRKPFVTTPSKKGL